MLKRSISSSRPTTVPARRRGAAAGALAAAVALVVAGCSSGSDDTGSGDAATVAKGTFPAKVSTKFGDVTVKEQPKRVVALGWGDAETALALGVQPVGASDWLAFGGDGVGPWAKGKYDKSPKKIGTLEPEYEKIAALQPDLILDTKSSGDQKRYDTLSKIAPTVGVPKGGDQYLTDWQDQTEMVADALGLHDKGQQLIARTKAKFATAVKEHPEFKGKTVTSGSLSGEGFNAYVKGSGRVDFLERLGFKNNPWVEQQGGKGFFVSVARENVNKLDADLLIMEPIETSASEIKNDALYKKIPAVQAGHDVVFGLKSAEANAFATDSVLSVNYVLDNVVPEFAKALKN
ncbi:MULTISPECIES: iron-siderophore ABC transporter substrate-binding protein [unclassified Streptomyces]|uniref:iron-siderophore ABC transporter substrate-binding protein n=1 Tax=unclassified Streptomyces TaxID=2593676 RepID=UPI000DB9636F|nr:MULTISPECIES: iron-siderophore ABC transporter substrate-binding protein [unclassified Streptomyces]MYT74944.1 ABC transporter substrate-binding protein [Streptomyces sp. SID8367]RAJ91936.1 iron complex transport system substrate-binding protein [Streptomyces sp. PsTaAH-137]